jgi:F-type H+-transporting ATPase subunit gamma
MPSLKSLKIRINSIKSTRKITSAMKMVAASKLKKASEESHRVNQYVVRLQETIELLRLSNPNYNHPAFENNGIDSCYLLVIISGDRGLCGGFNATIIKKVKQDIERWLQEGKEIKIICLGKKGYDLLNKKYGSMIIEYKSGLGGKNKSSIEESYMIAHRVNHVFLHEGVDKCYVYNMKMINTITQVPERHLVLPIQDEVTNLGTNSANMVFECEPSIDELLALLIERSVAIQICSGILKSHAAENAARMSAMDSATRNCGDMLKKLALLYNRTRQAYITKELIEIISGAEAL